MREVDVSPQFLFSTGCGCLSEVCLVDVKKGKVTVHCPNCKGVNVASGY
jgi:hypothetical protein